MSSKTNKASLLGAIITLVTASVISISAQTPAADKTLTIKPDAVGEMSGPALQKKSEPAAEGAALTTEPGKVSEVKRSLEVSDSTGARAGTTVAGGAEEEGRGATAKAVAVSPQTTSSDGWQFQVTPYFWLVSLHGNAGIGNRTAGVEMK